MAKVRKKKFSKKFFVLKKFVYLPYQISIMLLKYKKVKTIRVKFQWTVLMKLSDTGSTFKSVSTGFEDFTFEEIQQLHIRNYKGVGKVYEDNGYFMDPWRNDTLKMNINRLKEKIEGSHTAYIVELDYPWLRFIPVLRTKRELLNTGRKRKEEKVEQGYNKIKS